MIVLLIAKIKIDKYLRKLIVYVFGNTYCLINYFCNSVNETKNYLNAPLILLLSIKMKYYKFKLDINNWLDI